jgi:hypothetical protein
MVGEGICRFEPIFLLPFRPSVTRLQMIFDASCNSHGGLGLLACIERIILSRANARYKKSCFADGAAIDQLVFFITSCDDTK